MYKTASNFGRNKPDAMVGENITDIDRRHRKRGPQSVAEIQRHTLAVLFAAVWFMENGHYVWQSPTLHRGPADLVALIDGKLVPVDVKTAPLARNKFGEWITSPPSVLTPEQISIGARALYVTSDGLCAWHPRAIADRLNLAEAKPT